VLSESVAGPPATFFLLCFLDQRVFSNSTFAPQPGADSGDRGWDPSRS